VADEHSNILDLVEGLNVGAIVSIFLQECVME